MKGLCRCLGEQSRILIGINAGAECLDVDRGGIDEASIRSNVTPGSIGADKQEREHLLVADERLGAQVRESATEDGEENILNGSGVNDLENAGGESANYRSHLHPYLEGIPWCRGRRMPYGE